MGVEVEALTYDVCREMSLQADGAANYAFYPRQNETLDTFSYFQLLACHHFFHAKVSSLICRCSSTHGDAYIISFLTPSQL